MRLVMRIYSKGSYVCVSLISVTYQQQTFITADQSAFQRAGTTGQYAITGQPSPLAPVAAQAPQAATPQRPLNGQFIDPAGTTVQPVAYDRQEYVNGYQQQVSCRTINLSDF